MKITRFLLLLLSLLAPALAVAGPVETEIPGVTAEVLELRQQGGVLRLAIRFANGGAEKASSDRFSVGSIALVDVKSKQKHFPIRDANKQYVAGPIGDWIDGGRIDLTIPPGGENILWAVFEPVAPGSVLEVSLPGIFPFEDVPVTEGPGTLLEPGTAGSTPTGALATLVSAKRADQAVRVRLKFEGDPNKSVVGPYFVYRDVYLFDPASKRKYPVLKDSEGLYEAQPAPYAIDGGTFIFDFSKPTLVSMTMQAPPDSVQTVDLVLPEFLPFEGVALVGEGGAGAGGIAAAGKAVGLEGALKELQAEVTPQEIKIDLSADVLFDFDKADLKPAAEEKLQQVLTVVNSRPGSQVAIDGHTDVRGDAAYNQSLSERRAASVRAWLAGHGIEPARITATGAGESRPLRTGDTEADHQANRRVEIRIRN